MNKDAINSYNHNVSLYYILKNKFLKYKDAIHSNDHDRITKLFKSDPITCLDKTSLDCDCYIKFEFSINRILLNDKIRDPKVNINFSTWKLLIDLGIIKSTDINLLYDYAEKTVSIDECIRFYEIFELFDTKAIGLFTKYEEEEINTVINSTKQTMFTAIYYSYGLTIPIWKRNNFLDILNKLLAYGCKIDYPELNNRLFHKCYISYDSTKNVITQSNTQYVKEINEYLSYAGGIYACELNDYLSHGRGINGRKLDETNMKYMFDEIESRGIIYDAKINRVSI